MKNFKKIVVATRNPAKIEYYKSILVHIADEIVGLDNVNVTEKPLETGDTSEENACIKAKFYSQRTGLPVFCEDEALYVDFLPQSKQPGTHVRRINGKEEVDDDKLLEHWEKLISDVPKSKRTGYWHISYCIATPDGKYTSAYTDHPIMFFSPSSEIRIPGWPMSSLQGSVRFKKPHSEQTEEERKISKQNTKSELIKILNELI